MSIEEKELQEAQARLEEKRQQSGVTSTQAVNPLASLLATLKIDPTSGDDEGMAKCELHLGLPLPCEECARQAAEARSRQVSRATGALKSINVGARYQGMTFADYLPCNGDAQKVAKTCERYAQTFAERLKNCDNLLMLGSPGTGKNMLAACICQSLASQGFSVLHTTALKLVRKIKESWGKGKDMTEQQAIDQFGKPDLLVIDEVGVQFGSETEKILLFEVVNDRYENLRPTIIISNLNAQGIEDYLGSRIIDRFHEGKSSVLEFNGKATGASREGGHSGN